MTVADRCLREGFSATTFHAWWATFGGMEADDANWLLDLKTENNRLKKLLP